MNLSVVRSEEMFQILGTGRSPKNKKNLKHLFWVLDGVNVKTNRNKNVIRDKDFTNQGFRALLQQRKF